jgi:hypothetical protein
MPSALIAGVYDVVAAQLRISFGWGLPYLLATSKSIIYRLFTPSRPLLG